MTLELLRRLTKEYDRYLIRKHAISGPPSPNRALEREIMSTARHRRVQALIFTGTER